MNQDQEQQQDQWEDPQQEHVMKPGDMLKQAREAKKISIDEAAAHLRLRKQLIEELEENKFDPKVAGTFTRGYLRSYAKFLEVPEQEVIDAYYALGFEAPRKDTMQSFSRKKSRETQDSRLMLITWIIAAILVASVILFAWQKSGEEELESRIISNGGQDTVVEVDPAQAFSDEAYETPNYSSEGSNTADDHVEPELEPARQAATEVTESQATRQQPVTSTQTADSVSRAQSQTTSSAATPERESEQQTDAEIDTAAEATNEVGPETAELVLHFRGDCWVRIDDAEGNTLAFGVKQAGYTMPLNGVQPYSLTLGAPHLVDVYFQGEVVDLSGLREGRVARLTVPDA